MPKLQQPLKALRQRYSLQINRGRELVSRQVARPQDFTHLVEDAERWDRENSLLAQSTYVGMPQPYDTLPPVPTHGDLAEDQHVLRANVAANVRRLEQLEAELAAARSGCLGR
jgi:hypothetical protein